MRDAGARIIGACCGSKPDHLLAMAEALAPVAGTISDLGDFLRAELRADGRAVDEEAVGALLEAVGNDLRELASAASQLASQAGSGSKLRISSAAASASQAGPGAAARMSSALRVGSCQAAWGSITTCGAPASQARSGFEVGASPVRSTSCGALAAAKCSERRSRS